MLTLLVLLLACPVPDLTPEPEAPPVATPVLDRAYGPALLKLLEGSSARVHVLEYVVYDSGSVHDVLDALAGAAGRGVEVSVVFDEASDDAPDVIAWLSARGVQAKLDSPSVKSHNKLFVVDDAVLLGSHNLTSSAFDENTEASVLLQSDALTAWYEAYFQARRESTEGEPASLPDVSGDVTPAYDAHVTADLEACLTGSAARVRLVMYAASYSGSYPGSEPNRLLEAVAAAHARGVDVRVVLDHSAWVDDHGINDAAITYLTERDVPLRLAPAAVTTHAKVLVCDDQAIVGDANWSYSGLTQYNGTSVVVRDADVAAELATWADQKWSESTAP